MELNYLILVHTNASQVERLINSLNDDNVNFFIHVDKKADIIEFKEIIKSRKNVYFLPDYLRVSVYWGNESILNAEINLLKFAVKNTSTGFFILLSGQCYPIKSNAFIKNYFIKYSDYNFLKSFPIPTKQGVWGKHRGMDRLKFYAFNISKNNRHFNIFPSIYHKEFYNLTILKNVVKLSFKKPIKLLKLLKNCKVPEGITFFGGELWWDLNLNTVKKILHLLEENPNYLFHFKDRMFPEEILINSLVRTHFSAEKCKKCITYINWKRPNVPLPVTFIEENFNELVQQQEMLFARKFDIHKDSKILDLIDLKLRS